MQAAIDAGSALVFDENALLNPTYDALTKTQTPVPTIIPSQQRPETHPAHATSPQLPFSEFWLAVLAGIVILALILRRRAILSTISAGVVSANAMTATDARRMSVRRRLAAVTAADTPQLLSHADELPSQALKAAADAVKHVEVLLRDLETTPLPEKIQRLEAALVTATQTGASHHITVKQGYSILSQWKHERDAAAHEQKRLLITDLTTKIERDIQLETATLSLASSAFTSILQLEDASHRNGATPSSSNTSTSVTNSVTNSGSGSRGGSGGHSKTDSISVRHIPELSQLVHALETMPTPCPNETPPMATPTRASPNTNGIVKRDDDDDDIIDIAVGARRIDGRQSASVRTMLSRVFADVYHSGEITRVQLEVAKQQWADARTMAVQQHEYLRWQLSNHAETMRHLENRKDRLDRERVLDERERERVAAMHEEKERAERLRVEALLKAEDDKIQQEFKRIAEQRSSMLMTIITYHVQVLLWAFVLSILYAVSQGTMASWHSSFQPDCPPPSTVSSSPWAMLTTIMELPYKLNWLACEMFAKFVPTLLLCVGGVGIVIIAFAPRFVQLIVLPVVAWYLFQSPMARLMSAWPVFIGIPVAVTALFSYACYHQAVTQPPSPIGVVIATHVVWLCVNCALAVNGAQWLMQ